MRLLTLAIALLLPCAVAAQDISKVNGSVSVDAGQHAGDVHSVNGSVNIGGGAQVQDAGTVNGSIQVGERAQVDNLHTVNGSVSLARGSQVHGEVHSTNGRITLDPGVEVANSVSNVNGTITLDHAHVAGGIQTTSGDLTIGEGSRVDGGIIVNEQHGWGNYNRPPHVVIGPHAIVRGTLDFRREVVLQVSDSAQIGPVKGASPTHFSGATP